MKQLNFYDKSDWLKGPWLDEPDYQSWLDDETHYACVARRNLFGAWCGFVGLDYRHVLYQVDSRSEELKILDVHGTVAFSDWAPAEDMNFYPGQRFWWIGFDCMQDDDLCPAFQEDREKKPRRRIKKGHTAVTETVVIYRNLDFVISQIEYLAVQLSTYDTRFY